MLMRIDYYCYPLSIAEDNAGKGIIWSAVSGNVRNCQGHKSVSCSGSTTQLPNLKNRLEMGLFKISRLLGVRMPLTRLSGRSCFEGVPQGRKLTPAATNTGVPMDATKLSPKQRKAIEVLVTSGNVTEAAAAAGVSRETIYAWMRTDKEFQAERDGISTAYVGELSTRLNLLAQQAISTLQQILTDPNAPVNARIRAADIVIGRQVQLYEMSDIARRITRLENIKI